MIRILIADDHPIVREGLKHIIDDCSDMQVIGEVANGSEVLARCADSNIDVLLLDITMPGMEFLELMPRIRKKSPALRIIVVSMHDEEHFALRAFKEGALGYLTKDRSSEELAKAIRRVYQGKSYVTESLADILTKDLEPGEKKLTHEMLSNREFQIFIQLGSGKRITDIANEMALSPKTISTYRTRIYQKMKFKNSAGLIRYAMETNLVE